VQNRLVKLRKEYSIVVIATGVSGKRKPAFQSEANGNPRKQARNSKSSSKRLKSAIGSITDGEDTIRESIVNGHKDSPEL
jgi:hypothetical protein